MKSTLNTILASAVLCKAQGWSHSLANVTGPLQVLLDPPAPRA